MKVRAQEAPSRFDVERDAEEPSEPVTRQGVRDLNQMGPRRIRNPPKEPSYVPCPHHRNPLNCTDCDRWPGRLSGGEAE